jgi:hypothetical protein
MVRTGRGTQITMTPLWLALPSGSTWAVITGLPTRSRNARLNRVAAQAG